ncbi:MULTISPECIES: 50S ribosomal protein L11 methyltransferase [unclassified Staphylococcus]|uniref:50S ribosomal protein L11 methyltransferase n=1 Tax=unclassified Staphylococcus TaxID=91994 RepID=UPI0021CE9D0B|nr:MULTISPECIES: 50S ribosomal protein L11 methyltransferase [unclassified Staphylococcus]UXR68640.1 50S ribosomal protein L11 methyltransferase [Staphylococcus sp. IVB6246]UXR70698.1 50S ribosomal protein L11 methyltransferase [Staphylococcus sp. IVB6240]UXR72928.1 50S ribosomal protein L11 methyltransferase [Staphylococcus sp. IVB6238]UXR75224.1 50S ribosomal protein L11 methyltransferase [Staphylococcus sp. IVB6233]UXR79424.1 50S ribosomal protein L11 methyltransferase [Staphylococcus sp. I
MNWIELSVTVNEDAEAIVSNVLQDFGSNGVAIEDSNEVNKEREDRFGEVFDLNPSDYPDTHMVIKGYYTEMQADNAFVERLKEKLSSIEEIDTNILQVSTKVIEESDWENEWKNYFHPFQASEKFFIVPSWETVSQDSDFLYIELDPGMAFGTGDHPTTSLCLKAIERVVKPHHSVIDVGTGSGILSIASHLIGAKSVKAIDLDEMAVKVAKDNFEKNGCASEIETATGNLLTNETAQYDVVIANILPHIIELMIEDSYERLNPSGYFITSGIIEEKSESIQSQMKDVGYEIIDVQHDNGWVCITGQKVS